jgi:CheY-like chemotaxis protein
MVFGFAKQSGGHARINSEVGRGTAVMIYLPASEIALAEKSLLVASVGAVPRCSGKILLVEDDDLVRGSVKLRLSRLGYDVTTAAMAAEAIRILEGSPPFDLLYTDIIMPGAMTGVDLICEVQRRWPGTKVLATSGYTETTMMGKLEIPDGVRLLSKPYSNAEFARTLRDVFAD